MDRGTHSGEIPEWVSFLSCPALVLRWSAALHRIMFGSTVLTNKRNKPLCKIIRLGEHAECSKSEISAGCNNWKMATASRVCVLPPLLEYRVRKSLKQRQTALYNPIDEVNDFLTTVLVIAPDDNVHQAV